MPKNPVNCPIWAKSALAVALVAWNCSAAAAPVTLSFTARVAGVDAALSGAAATGQGLNGTYTYDSSTPDSASDPSSGLYFNAGSLQTLNLGLLSWSANRLQMLLTDRPGLDIYSAEFGGAAGSGIRSGSFTYMLDSVTLSLTDNISGSALSSDRLGTAGPALSGFNIRSISLVFVNQRGGVAQILGDVNSLVTDPASTVPVPATGWLVLAGLGALGGTRRWAARAKA